MSTEIDRLIVVFDADFKALDAKMTAMITRLAAKKKQIEASTPGFGNALQKGISDLTDRASEAAKALPGLGSALSALGPEGIAAAVAIGLLVATIEQATKAAEFSEQLEAMGAKLGVNTDFLQAFNHALLMTGVSVQAGDEALQGLTASLGQVQEGLARKQTLKAWEALGFDRAGLQQFKNAEDLFPVLADRISKVGDVAQQAAIAKRLGITELLPLLRLGAGGFNALTEQARQMGIVMDSALIEKGAEANKIMKTTAEVVHTELTSAFAEAAPIVAALGVVFADVLKDVIRFTLATLDAATALGHFIVQTLHLPDPTAQNLHQGLAALATSTPTAKQQALRDQMAATGAIQYARYQAELAGQAKAGAGLPDTKVAKPSDFAEKLDSANKSLADAAKGAADAYLALTTNIEEQAKLEHDALVAETQAKIAAIQKQIDAAKGDKTITDDQRDQIVAQLELTQHTVKAAADAKDEAINREAIAKEAEQELTYRQFIVDQDQKIWRNTAALADTLDERRAINAKALASAQELERRQFEADAAKSLVGDPTYENANRIAAERAALLQRQGTDTALQQQTDAGPVTTYVKSIQDLNTVMSEAGVQAAKALSDGLVDALANAKNLGDVASSVFRQLISQIASAELQKNIFGPLLVALGLPGHAAGTLSSASGLALVGEAGPELVRLPGGSQVMSNSQLRNVGMGNPSRAGTTIVFDNRGAVIWEEAAKQLMSYADQAAATGAIVAVQTARQTTPSDLSRVAGRRL